MAKKNRGWIKLYRDITENEIWLSDEPFDRRSAWIDLLLMVNHEERTVILRNGKSVVVGPGQCLTSTVHLAKRWRWSRGRVNRYLELLTEQGMCTARGAAHGTMITLINWENFNGTRSANGTADGAANWTADGAADGARTRMYRECNKNVTNKKEPSPVPVSGSGGRVYE